MYRNGQIVYDTAKEKLCRITGPSSSVMVYSEMDSHRYTHLVDKMGGIFTGLMHDMPEIEKLLSEGKIKPYNYRIK